MKRLVLCMLLCLAGLAQLPAKVEILSFSTAQNEMRYKKLVDELRCLVCQNQNIASSNADLAKDLRQQVYTRIEKGESDQQIIAYMVERYGDFVLYKPPLNWVTAFLWLGPFLLLALGITVLVRLIRSSQAGGAVPEASVERARSLLKQDEPGS